MTRWGQAAELSHSLQAAHDNTVLIRLHVIVAALFRALILVDSVV